MLLALYKPYEFVIPRRAPLLPSGEEGNKTGVTVGARLLWNSSRHPCRQRIRVAPLRQQAIPFGLGGFDVRFLEVTVAANLVGELGDFDHVAVVGAAEFQPDQTPHRSVILTPLPLDPVLDT